jgi:hypothetical protein
MHSAHKPGGWLEQNFQVAGTDNTHEHGLERAGIDAPRELVVEHFDS